jgi:hypothetical protein
MAMPRGNGPRRASRADELAWLAALEQPGASRRLFAALQAARRSPAIDAARDAVGTMPRGEWLACELARLLGPSWLAVALGVAA